MIDDLETPVSAYLKIAAGRPYAFLFESVEGGAWRGRYSIVAMNPDLVWRCRGDLAEIAEGEMLEAGIVLRLSQEGRSTLCGTWSRGPAWNFPPGCRRWPPDCSAPSATT